MPRAKDFKLVTRKRVLPILEALNIRSVRVEEREIILDIRSPGSKNTIVRIPMGRHCLVFSAPGCRSHAIFKKETPRSKVKRA
jgi:hypothetical protein